MENKSSSYFTNRPINPDNLERTVAMTEWEYEEKHGFDSGKEDFISISDSSDFSSIGDRFESLSQSNDGSMKTGKLSFVDTERMGEALQGELDFLASTHSLSSQRARALEQETSERLSTAKYTYFDDLDAEIEISSDDELSRTSALRSPAHKSSKAESELSSTIRAPIAASSAVRSSARQSCSDSEVEEFVVNPSATIKQCSTLAGSGCGEGLSGDSFEDDFEASSTLKSASAAKCGVTISTMEDISSFHDTASSLGGSKAPGESATFTCTLGSTGGGGKAPREKSGTGTLTTRSRIDASRFKESPRVENIAPSALGQSGKERKRQSSPGEREKEKEREKVKAKESQQKLLSASRERIKTPSREKVKDKAPSFAQREIERKEKEGLARRKVPEEDELRRQRRVKELFGTDRLEELEGENALYKQRKEKEGGGKEEEDQRRREKKKKAAERAEEGKKEASEQERKCFFDAGETKAARLRNQCVRQKLILRAEEERQREAEERERGRRARAAGRRIAPDLRRLRAERAAEEGAAERRRQQLAEERAKSEEMEAALRRVEKTSSLLSREGQSLCAREVRNRMAKRGRTAEEVRIDEIHARRARANESLRAMWA